MSIATLHPIPSQPAARARTLPQLSPGRGFWAVAFAFLVSGAAGRADRGDRRRRRRAEGRRPVHARPSCRPQRLRAPAEARGPFVAATTGAFLVFAIGGLFAGLAATFLAGPLHHPSAALTGFAILLNFGAGVLVQITTTRWPAPRLIVAGLAPMFLGLVVLVASARTSPASLALFLIGGAIVGAGGGAILRGSLTVVIATAGAADRAGALATFFTAGCVGLSLPVLGLGVALQFLSPRVTLLVFTVAVGLGILAAAPQLVRRPRA